MGMHRRFVRLGLFLLVVPAGAGAQGRETKVYYDNGFTTGSQRLQRTQTEYFEILTTPEREDPQGELLRYWGPKLDDLYLRVAGNLCLTRAEIYRYLLFPRYFGDLEKLCIEGRLSQASFDSVVALSIAVHDRNAPRPSEPLVFPNPRAVQARVSGSKASPQGLERHSNLLRLQGDAVYVWLPGPTERVHQRCVLYRTLADFMATPIGPPLPEGVLGFVPTHDKDRPVVIYASLGEHKLHRTAQHEIGHAVVEGVADYLRELEPARMRARRYAPKDTTNTKAWNPASGGFSGITHENFAEYLAFPCGQMDPTLRSALVEMVAENRLDGLAAISVGARTIASSYIEGPARLVFLAERFGHDFPKRLLVTYYTQSLGFLEVIEKLTGMSMQELEQLYKRWLRERFWSQSLRADIPDTMGSILSEALSGVRRDGQTLLSRAAAGRQEIVLLTPGRGRRAKPSEHVIVRDLDGPLRLPLFSTPDLQHGRVVTVVRDRNEETLLLWDRDHGRRMRALSELGAVREISDPRLSPSARAVVCRVVDRSGRNGIGHLDLETNHARYLVQPQWTEVINARFAESETRVVFASTATANHNSDLFSIDVQSGEIRNLTQTPDENEVEPLVVNGHLICLADAGGILTLRLADPGDRRQLVNLPFPVERLQRSDSTLTLVAHSLRHDDVPAGRAVWEFPLRRLGLDRPLAPPEESAQLAAGRDAFAVPGIDPVPGLGSGGLKLEPVPAPLASETGAASEPSMLALTVTAYKQKWRLMPLGLNVNGSGATTRGISMMGFDTEFHDQSIVVAGGQDGKFDRFGLVQYRNSASRTHWQASGFYRSVLRQRYTADSSDIVNRDESEAGLLLSAQYHLSLITRLGLGLSLTERTDAIGRLVARPQDIAPPQAVQAPLLGLQLPGLSPSSWRLSLGGISDLSLLCDRSPTGLAAWTQAIGQNTEPDFVPSNQYVRPNVTLHGSLSRDTRVWSDYRGPNSGSLVLFEVSGGMNAGGTRTLLSSTQSDSVHQHVVSGLDQLSSSWLYLTHRRLGFVDLAFRCRGLMNQGPEALVYGLGGLYSVAGYPEAIVRSQRIAWSNTEARVQLWDYSSWRVPFHAIVFPAGDAFLYSDAGVADGARGLYSYGAGLRLRLGFLSFEWRHSLRSGQPDERGLSFVW